VLLDRIGVVSCQRGGVQLPRQTWGGEHADDAAAERFLEATLRRARISSPPVTTGGAARRGTGGGGRTATGRARRTAERAARPSARSAWRGWRKRELGARRSRSWAPARTRSTPRA
jgi:hypothetical protein